MVGSATHYSYRSVAAMRAATSPATSDLVFCQRRPTDNRKDYARRTGTSFCSGGTHVEVGKLRFGRNSLAAEDAFLHGGAPRRMGFDDLTLVGTTTTSPSARKRFVSTLVDFSPSRISSSVLSPLMVHSIESSNALNAASR
jgi:hypothetical protein